MARYVITNAQTGATEALGAFGQVISTDARRSYHPLFSDKGWAYRNATAIMTFRTDPTGGVATGRNEFYDRVWIRLRKLPSANHVFWWDDVLNNPTCAWVVDSTGQVSLYKTTTGALDTAFVTFGPFALDEWHCLEVHWSFGGGAGPASVSCRLDGGVVQGPFSTRSISSTSWGTHIGLVIGTAQGLWMDLADYAVDGSDWVGTTARGTVLKPTAAGTYNGGIVDSGLDWRAAVNMPTGRSFVSVGAPESFGINTNGNVQSFLIGTLSDFGITGAIKAVRIMAQVATGATASFLIRRNGVDTFQSATFSSGTSAGYTFAVSDWSPSDVVEIGVRLNAAGTLRIASLALLVDHETAEPASSPDTSIRVVEGTYTGNAGHQTIDCSAVDSDTANLTPKAVFIVAESTTSGGWFWWDGRLYASHMSDSQANSQAIIPAKGGFHVGGSTSSDPNQSAQTYRWIAIFDESGRMTQTASYFFAAGADNTQMTLRDATFTPDAVFALQDTSGSVGQTYYRDTSFAGDSTSQLNAASVPLADAVQAISAGVIEVGTKLTATVALTQAALLCFRKSAFTQTKLFDVVSYTGDGTGSRDIALDLSGKTPVFALAIPKTTINRYVRTSGMTTARPFNGGSETANTIIGWGSNLVQVGSGLNTNGVDYAVFVLAAGTDLETTPEISIPRTGFVGITWVELFDAQENTRVWSNIALPDPSAYYHGYKEDRIVNWGSVRRGLSDRQGNYVGSDFSWTTSDTDRIIRALLSNPQTQYFSNMPATVRMVDDDSRRLRYTPRTMFKGVVNAYRPLANLLFEFSAIDPLSKRFNQHNGTKLPWRTITTADFPNCPADTIGKAVPIIYGHVSDRNLVTIEVPDELPFDATLPKPGGQAMLDVGDAPTGQLSGGVSAVVCCVKAGKQGPPSYAGGTYVPGPYQRSVLFGWNKVDGVDSYRVYFFDGWWQPYAGAQDPNAQPTFVRMIEHDNTTDYDGSYGWPGFRTFAQIFHAPTDGTDFFTPGIAQRSSDDGHGVIQPIYVGVQDVGGTSYHKFLIAGHACKEIEEIYVDGVSQDIQNDANQAGAGGIWLVPGYAGWTAAFGAAVYETINGKRYSVMYGKVGNFGPDRGAGTVSATASTTTTSSTQTFAPLTVNVKGIEDAGDGTGDLITDIHQQYKHLTVNWVLQSYETGDWLTTPVFADDAGLEQVDTASFDAASELAAIRIDGGYIGAFVVGANGDLTTLRDLISEMNLSADVDCYFNRKTQFAVSMEAENTDDVNAADVLTDIDDILADSFEIEDRLSEHFNVIPVYYAADYSGRDKSGWLATTTFSDATSIANYDEEKQSFNVELTGVRDQATAEDIGMRRLRRTKNPPRYCRFRVGLQGLNYELGDIVKITHFDGVGASGWVKRPIRITKHEVDAENYTVTLEGYDMGDLFATAFILGDETALAADWASASVLDRQYGYLCDETTGQFSDGENGKRLM